MGLKLFHYVAKNIRDISFLAKSILIYLSVKAGEEAPHTTWASIQSIIDETNCTRAQVYRALKELTDKHLISKKDGQKKQQIDFEIHISLDAPYENNISFIENKSAERKEAAAKRAATMQARSSQIETTPVSNGDGTKSQIETQDDKSAVVKSQIETRSSQIETTPVSNGDGTVSNRDALTIYIKPNKTIGKTSEKLPSTGVDSVEAGASTTVLETDQNTDDSSQAQGHEQNQKQPQEKDSANKQESPPDKSNDTDDTDDTTEGKPKKKAPSKTLADYNPDYVAFARAYQEAILKEHGAMAPTIDDHLLLACTDSIDKMVRIDKIAFPEIQQVLRWAYYDPFWSRQVLSLAGLRKKSQNGLKKIQNLLVAWKRSTNNQPNNTGGFDWQQTRDASYYVMQKLGHIQ